jgi:hypothetical protein
MDSLFWTTLNPNIKVECSTKKYFNTHLYKLVLFCPAGRLIDSKGSMREGLTTRITIEENRKIMFGWMQFTSKHLNSADAGQLDRMRTLKKAKVSGLRIRVEEPRIQIYATSEAQLQDVIKQYFDPIDHQHIESVYGPADSKAEAALNSGAILKKATFGYRYKIILRDGRYDPQVKKNVLNYLMGIGNENVHLPASVKGTLAHDGDYMWGIYFYSNDLSFNSFLELICPGIILNCHELVVL